MGEDILAQGKALALCSAAPFVETICMILARPLPLVISLCVAATACSSPPAPSARAFVSANFTPGTNGAQCGSQGASFQLGTATGSNPTPEVDGQTIGTSAQVNVQCVVQASGGGYKVDAVGILPTGKFEVTNMAVGTIDSTGGQNVHVTLVNTGVGWAGDGCTIAYTYQGNPISTQPVQPGRIWGHASCPVMTNTSGGQRVIMVNGQTKSVPEQCDGEIDFQFQDCSS